MQNKRDSFPVLWTRLISRYSLPWGSWTPGWNPLRGGMSRAATCTTEAGGGPHRRPLPRPRRGRYLRQVLPGHHDAIGRALQDLPHPVVEPGRGSVQRPVDLTPVQPRPVDQTKEREMPQCRKAGLFRQEARLSVWISVPTASRESPGPSGLHAAEIAKYFIVKAERAGKEKIPQIS